MGTLFPSADLIQVPPTEMQLRRSVLDRLRRDGWLVHMLPQQRGQRARTATGWPDVVAVKSGRMLVIELKAEAGTLSDAQVEWLQALDAVAGIETMVLKPSGFKEWERMLERGHWAV